MKQTDAPSLSRAGTPALLLLTALLAVSSGTAAAIDEQAVYVSGQGGYHTYRIPALVRTNAGTLLAFCEGRRNSSSDTGDIDLLVRRSSDGGATWGPPIVVWNDGANTCGNPAPVVDTDTGTIHLLSTWNLGSDAEGKIINGASTDTRRVFVLTSADDGVTWGAAKDITATAKQPGWTWYATGPGAGIRLSRGAQAGRLFVPCDHILAGKKSFGSHVLFSDDGGKTWRVGAVASSTATVHPNENLCVELLPSAPGGGSRVYFNARDHQGGIHRARAVSDDGGATYTPAEFVDAPEFTTPTVQGGLARWRAADAGDPGNRILFSCPNGRGRNRMSIWSSRDEARTWSAPKLVYEGPSAYSDMTRLTDGRMGLLFEKGVASPYESIVLARFDEAWLDAPAPLPGSQGTPP